PNTRSGKILRRTMRPIVQGGQVAAPATVEEPGVLEAFAGQERRGENESALETSAAAACNAGSRSVRSVGACCVTATRVFNAAKDVAARFQLGTATVAKLTSSSSVTMAYPAARMRSSSLRNSVSSVKV